MLFTEKQKLNRLFPFLLVTIAVIIIIINRNLLGVMFFLIMVFVAFSLWKIELNINVSDKYIFLNGKFPFIMDKRIAINEISDQLFLDFSIKNRLSGWGYRLSPNSEMFNVSGKKLVFINLKNIKTSIYFSINDIDGYNLAIKNNLT